MMHRSSQSSEEHGTLDGRCEQVVLSSFVTFIQFKGACVRISRLETFIGLDERGIGDIDQYSEELRIET